ncbi:MAG: lysophospholipid acyltransferase family protein [Phycisphaerae bacterium]|jgi:1-acyl-sn-glycerol-3-phosphate acyltransferase
MSGPTSYPNPLLRGFAPGGSKVQQANWWYLFSRQWLQVLMPAAFKVRVFNRRVEPAEGGAVYICNHQSFLDPILMSFALCRPMNYMARDSLFRWPLFRLIIESANAFPVRRGTADLAALKEAMRRIKDGGQVVLFAEGTRTLDGRIGPFLPGVAMLAQRVAQWTVPVVIDGAFECWPRTQALPSPGNIVVQYGRPMPQEQVRKMAPEELMGQVRNEMIEIQAELRRRVGREPLDYGKPFPTSGAGNG